MIGTHALDSHAAASCRNGCACSCRPAGLAASADSIQRRWRRHQLASHHRHELGTIDKTARTANHHTIACTNNEGHPSGSIGRVNQAPIMSEKHTATCRSSFPHIHERCGAVRGGGKFSLHCQMSNNPFSGHLLPAVADRARWCCTYSARN